MGLGETELIAGNQSVAMQYYLKAKPIAEGLAAVDAHNIQALGDVAALYLSLSAWERQNGGALSALEHCLRAVAIREELSAANPSNALTRRDLASAYFELADVYGRLAANTLAPAVQQQQNWRTAKDWYEKSLEIFLDMKSKGTLSAADASKPDELANDIAKCDLALKSIAPEKPTS
jgi:hypothetical protein